jgi:adenine-specific DNA glycosylase
MTYVRVVNGEVLEYPYMLKNLKKDFQHKSFPTNPRPGSLAEVGVYPVYPTPKPTGDIVVEGTPVFENGEWVRTWNVTNYTLEEVKAKKRAEIAATRYLVETNHPTLDTSRISQAMINGVWSAAQIDENILVDFKQPDGSWAQLDAANINILASAVISHVQQCFSHEKTLNLQVDQASDRANVESIDITTGWPSNSAGI